MGYGAFNRKLLTSVFNGQEAREAILGGARIIDSEDPKTALGNIAPLRIMEISKEALDYRAHRSIQLSTNIGEDQLLFRRSDDGNAVIKSSSEMAGKAAQAAIGVATAMGTRVHPCNVVKVGLDGMDVHLLKEVLEQIVVTLARTEHFSQSQVMSVLFAQDLDAWNVRKVTAQVRERLVALKQFNATTLDDRTAFDVTSPTPAREFRATAEHKASVLRDLKEQGLLPAASDGRVRVAELYPHSSFFPNVGKTPRTNRDVIEAMVEATVAAGAHSMMIDTSILSKVSNICLFDTSDTSEVVDVNAFSVKDGLVRSGILKLDDLRFFVDFCHFRGISANLAGSIDSLQAQQLWCLIPNLDQLSTRGSAAAAAHDPRVTGAEKGSNRENDAIQRHLVRGLTPPEQGGVLNVPKALLEEERKHGAVKELVKMLTATRSQQGWPQLEVFAIEPGRLPQRIQQTTL